MLPKMIYKQAYIDITIAYHEGTYNTNEWVSRLKAIYEDFEKYYPNQTLMEE